MIRRKQSTIIMTDREHVARAIALLDAAKTCTSAALEQLEFTTNLKGCGEHCDTLADAIGAVDRVRRTLRRPR